MVNADFSSLVGKIKLLMENKNNVKNFLIRPLARLFDLSPFLWITANTLGVFLLLLAKGQRPVVAFLVYNLVFLIGILIAIIFELFSHAVFKNTIGKFLLGLRIERKDSGPLTLSTVFKRTFAVLIFGLGLGVFPLNVIAILFYFFYLIKNKTTPWDKFCETRVTYSCSSFRHVIAILLLPFILYFVLGIVSLLTWQLESISYEMKLIRSGI